MQHRSTEKGARGTRRSANRPSRLAAACAEQVRGCDDPYSAESGYNNLHTLIATQVLDRLNVIFEQVRHLDKPNQSPAGDNSRAIRLPEVLDILGISKSALYDRLNPKSPSYDPAMPKQIKLGNSDRSPSVWWHSEVIAYLASRTKTRNSA